MLVATPGRLMDFVNRGRITFNSIRFVVLDEADRMLDMGFLPEMEKMMGHDTMVEKVSQYFLTFSFFFFFSPPLVVLSLYFLFREFDKPSCTLPHSRKRSKPSQPNSSMNTFSWLLAQLEEQTLM